MPGTTDRGKVRKREGGHDEEDCVRGEAAVLFRGEMGAA